MVKVKITYETLFDLLRKEKSRNELQELEKSFYTDVAAYMKDKLSTLEQSGSSTSIAEKEKIKIQIKNINRILKELTELREKKILNLAMNKVKTDSNLIDLSKMLLEEKNLFDEAVILLQKFKQTVLTLTSPTNAPEPEVKTEENTVPEPETKQNVAPETLPIEKEPVIEKASESMTIKFLANLPKFMGLDKKIYGPYDKNSVEELPSNIAELLLKKGRAELAS